MKKARGNHQLPCVRAVIIFTLLVVTCVGRARAEDDSSACVFREGCVNLDLALFANVSSATERAIGLSNLAIPIQTALNVSDINKCSMYYSSAENLL
jgi:hypothetical protein